MCHGRGDTTSGLTCTKCNGKGVITGLKTGSKKARDSSLWGSTIVMKKKNV